MSTTNGSAKPILSIVVPIYNEEAVIDTMHQRLYEALLPIGVSFEIIYVNDGSKDNSMPKIKTIAAKVREVKYIDFSRNFGHQIAVSAGIDFASGDYIGTIDGDLQDPPELFKEMFDKMQEGFDVVYARRKKRDGEPFLRLAAIKLFYRILKKMTSISIPVDTGDFRLMNRKIVDNLKKMPEKNKYLRGQIAWIGFNQTFVEYDRNERFAGETGYPLRKLIGLAFDGITGFSDVPLKIVTYFGLIVSGIAFLVLLYVLYSRLISHNYIQGWASILTCVLFLGGVQLIAIGIIGEYLSRMNHNLRDRPLYIVRDTNVSDNEASN